MWKAAKAGDGRTYYYHEKTKETRWEKPEGFQEQTTPQHDPAAVDAAWKKTEANGRVYYYNSLTRATAWEPPAAYLRLQQEQESAQGGNVSGPTFVAGGDDGGDRPGSAAFNPSERRMERRDPRDGGLPQRPSMDDGRGGGSSWEQRQQQSSGFRGAMPKSDDLEFPTPELAEEAFVKLLRKHNILPETSWEDALRAVIREREFRAIKDPLKRKQAFEKYRVEVRAQEKSKEKERRQKLREDFRQMLQTHEEIKHYSRWKTVRPIIEREAVFKQAGNDDERRNLFEEYLVELKRKHAADSAAKHQAALQSLKELVQASVTDPQTRWEDARETLMNGERFKSDPALSEASKLDVFNAFQQHVSALDNQAVEEKMRSKDKQRRRDREARDAFKQLLHEKVAQRKITADSKWSDLYPSIERDERYLTLTTTTGSTPLDLFFDAVERLRSELRSKSNDMLDTLSALRYEATLDTTFNEFVSVMRSDPRTARFDEAELDSLYKDLMDRLAKRTHDERGGDVSRQERKAVEALRSAMRRAEPPIRPSDSYEDVADRLADNPDFKASSTEARRQAFEKHMRRLKDREDEQHEHDRSRRDRDRDRDRDRERERDRDRDRDRADHRSNGSRRDHPRDRDPRHRTRSPEIDAYEADRRKAQAERERQYRKASFGLTPPPRDRRGGGGGGGGGDEREYRRRGAAGDDGGHYERERRERESERESRSYTSRADPRERGRVLDYGDEGGDTASSRPSSTRKRRDSDASGGSNRREVKRRRQTRTPEPAKDDDEAPQLQSGSEEGEIEEV